MSKNQEQKELERDFIEQARRYSAAFPTGELTGWERPDWLIRSASLGIEVSALHAPTAAGSFSGAQLLSFQRQVVQQAERQYCKLSEAPANVFAFFRNEWRRKTDTAAIAESLARLVLNNYPADGRTVTLDSRITDKWLEGLGVVRIAPSAGEWQAGGANTNQPLTYDHLASRIAVKNERVKEYRARLPTGWRLWLLLATELNVLLSVRVPLEVIYWQFDFAYDKIWLFDWEQGLIELQRKSIALCL